uniref:MD-2-related lipid-recognition domain-containing protein n=1 Tax=Anopheles albimanus TaxID=7167 RepID=A0A1I8JSM5_ANOAL
MGIIVQYGIFCIFLVLHQRIGGQVRSGIEGWRVVNYQCIGTPYQKTTLHYCNTLRVPNGTTYLNASLHVPYRLTFINIAVKTYYKYTTYKPFIVDWKIEVCQAMRARRYNPMAQVVAKVFKETIPSMYYPCPHGNTTYTVVWALDAKYYPKSIPSGDYRIDISFKDAENITIYAMQVYATMRKQGLIG